ncbi:Pentatricopeptide repeat-containing protein 2, mitochondrial [Larimichthys crocea]|uniref:Uncharacterized protein n=1 Tax=Larimichthys crocea TaxID=215358 RepID=A0ACD3QMT5_LARCR|nr:Pentatricopeptide repeat-containing protein 2, mitochondrial [Larimichthys crocea]
MALARLGRCCRSLAHESSKGVFLQPGGIEGCTGAKRHLLSEDVIKLQNFQQKKLSVAHLGTGSKGNYIELFSQKLQKNELILRDELKLLLHLCQSADDMVIARDAIYRYHVENRNFIEFRFGPLFMRLCYELGLEDLAVATLTDERMQGFFNDATSFNIAIDMLFTKGSYINALDVLRTMKKQGVPFNKDTMMLAFGTCYKLVVIQAMSGAVTDAISILSAAIMPNSPTFVKKPVFSEEVVDVLRLRTEGQPDMMKVEQIVTQLEQADQVTQQTLDDMLCQTPTGKRKPIMEERRISRRTLQPLRSTLLSE